MALPNSPSASANTTILVADANPVVRLVCKSLLERNGFRCVLADNGRRALSIILDEHPNAVVLDLAMPNMHGFEVLRQMRSSDVARAIPVLVLTGCRDAEAVAIAARLDSEYMEKPIKSEELMVRLRRLVTGGAAEELGAFWPPSLRPSAF